MKSKRHNDLRIVLLINEAQITERILRYVGIFLTLPSPKYII